MTLASVLSVIYNTTDKITPSCENNLVILRLLSLSSVMMIKWSCLKQKLSVYIYSVVVSMWMTYASL